MQYFFPSYYKDFKCIAGECRHNCCIGWEIDIDLDAMSRYFSVGGKFGARLKANISGGDEPHFILGKGDRCPFLNDKNLCDIIITLGEESLCSICADHPRFRNELPGRIETGLGLCCEAAARLILGTKSPVTFECCGNFECGDYIIDLRDEVIILLQNRALTIRERIACALTACRAENADVRVSNWADFLLTLERLDDAWTVYLNMLKCDADTLDYAQFDAYMSDRQSEYEQILVYLIYRHLANAVDETGVAARAAFAALGFEIIHTLGALIFNKNGEFTFEEQAEIARLFSSEIEYSEDNLYSVIDKLSEQV